MMLLPGKALGLLVAPRVVVRADATAESETVIVLHAQLPDFDVGMPGFAFPGPAQCASSEHSTIAERPATSCVQRGTS